MSKKTDNLLVTYKLVNAQLADTMEEMAFEYKIPDNIVSIYISQHIASENALIDYLESKQSFLRRLYSRIFHSL